MTSPIISAKKLKKYFPVTAGLFKKQVGTVKAVDGVDLEIFPGEVVGLVGESGSGKSTFARAMIRLIEPTGGEIIYRGEELLHMNQQKLFQVRQDVQVIFQDPYASLNPRKSVAESIGEALLYHGVVKTEQAQRTLVAEAMEKVGLSPDVMDRYPHQFSGGQQQRICIARAIVMNPKLIICDESVSALDVSVQAQILNLLQELKESMNLSYLFISHDLSVVRHICDRVVVLYLGKVMEVAPTDELFKDPKHPYTQALLSATPIDHPCEKREKMVLTGEIPSPLHPPSGCPFRTRCPHAQEVCSSAPPKMEPDGKRHYFCILP